MVERGVPPPPEARGFRQARAARSSVLFEDYTELIADLIATHGEARMTDIARCLGVAHPTAIKAVARLKRAGLAAGRPYRGVFLTEAGQAMAERSRTRHHLVVAVLRAVGVPEDAASADAEGIEHHVSEATLHAFEAFLRRKADKPQQE
ncbi:manganese-binding transcriptional regulator MntR [Acidocella sp.]|uniref:manganese-binding transcriptional regulator MntR n=1 Tax=Acidocella sp. TaxID=50710 RepID=UPI002638001A|nr:manganese-binding transcriptional regulator MntR [Acidocella sp.]